MNKNSSIVIKIIIALISIIIISAIIFNKLINTKYDSLNNMDKKMLKQLSQVYEIYNNNSKDIWKEDYNVKDIALILTPVQKENDIFQI